MAWASQEESYKQRRAVWGIPVRQAKPGGLNSGVSNAPSLELCMQLHGGTRTDLQEPHS